MSSHTASDILSLWVMRLNRPVFVKQQCEPAELYLDDIAGSLTFSDAGVRSDLDGVPLHRLSMASISSASVDPTPTVAGDHCQSNSSNSQNPDDFIHVKVGGPGELLHLPQSFGYGGFDTLPYSPCLLSFSPCDTFCSPILLL
ncbi:unnamed protein product [Dicrocoelium dendriticum]|nr:unnamed protein product [Dicrocoelium dendriticum]